MRFMIILRIFCILIGADLVFCLNRAQFDVSRCHVDLTCGEGQAFQGDAPPEGQGRPGKRGSTGPKGESGQKGEKGDECVCALQNEREVNDIRREITRLTHKACPQTKYIFPRGGQTSDYIRVKVPVQQMMDVSICFWLTGLPTTSIKGTMFSYNIPALDNALMLMFQSGKFKLHVASVEKNFNIVVKERTHFCIAIDSQFAKVYTNGTLRSTLHYSRSLIPGGGAFVLGQDQDKMMGSFDSSQAFSGTIENLMIWDRALTVQEISAMKRDSCSCPIDYAIALTPDVIQLEGEVTALPLENC